VEGGTIAVVPARRLAKLLTEARRHQDESVTALAERSGGAFTPDDLLAIERGAHELDDDTVRRVVELYEVDPGVLALERSRLEIDLDERRVRTGTHEEPFSAPTADEVLTTYLSLVYTMRHATPGTPLPLRDADISVLGRVLELTSTDVESRLVDLMADPDDEVRTRHRWLRRRVLVPAAGVLVAVTAIGSLVLVSSNDDHGADEPVVPVTTSAIEQPTVSLIPPVVMERDPSGQPGPQVTIGADGGAVVAPDSSGAPVTTAVDIGDAIVMERGPGGEPGPQVTR
jgi:hypothetical protein